MGDLGDKGGLMNTTVKQALNVVLEKFKTGDIPEAVAYSIFPIPDIPSARWSLMNRTIMFLFGTQDARGYRQWQQVNRHVKKGAKALHILVPFIKKTESHGEEVQVLLGFGSKPVFKVQDTDGEPLDYQNIQVPSFPLIEKAKEWGISVKAVSGGSAYYGFYDPNRQEIVLATQEECVFFHELAHVGHERFMGRLKNGQDPFQEIVAELVSLILCRLVGKSGERHLGNNYRYIERYSEKFKLTPHQACMRVLGDVEKVLDLILSVESHEQEAEEKTFKPATT